MDQLTPPPVARPKVSVIIPAYNAAATIEACVRAVRGQTYDQPYEIIVVDDGSTDSTAALAEAAGARVLRRPRGRPAAARNAGIAAARGSIICCTDADCEPVPEWLVELTRPLADPTLTATKGAYATRQSSLVARFVQLEYEDKYDLMARVAAIDFIDTYSAAYRRTVLCQHAGFDERFDYLEDQELSFRLAAAGEAMVFAPAAVVYHRHADTLRAYARKKVIIGYWKVQVVRRFPERAVRDSHTPQVMKLQIALAAVLLLSAVALLTSTLFSWWPGVVAAAVVGALTTLSFLVSTLPFAAKAWPKDQALVLLSPGLLFMRAVGLGLGTAWGILHPHRGLADVLTSGLSTGCQE
jgi:cellulose synthase/poly-beta-1,6-N-acetylglucosamine synthase-like glycosyltransferase